VLNIGVGQGHCTRALAGRGCEVSALDISRHALDKVASVIRAGYLASALHELPESAFDLAISFLVTQHVDDAALWGPARCGGQEPQAWGLVRHAVCLPTRIWARRL